MSQNVEELFLFAFTDQINIELDRCYHPKKEERDYIATTEQVVALAQTGLFFAGIASAPFTFGLGLGVAAATIVVIKAGQVCIEHYQAQRDAAQQLPQTYLNQQRELQRLALFLLLRQSAFAVYTRYHYSLHQVLDEEGVQTFAQYVAHRLMKKLYAELCQNPNQLPPVDIFVDYLLSSIHSSWIMSTEEVSLKTPLHANILRLAVHPKKISTKHFCARQRWLSYEDTDVHILGVETDPFHDQFQPTSTRYELGYITIEDRKKTEIPLAIKAKDLRRLTIEDAEKEDIVSKSLFPHLVTRDEVDAYKIFYSSHSTTSFNAYLSERYKRPIIACCHDDRLQGVAFVGDYTKVNFYAAILTECDFSGAIFNHANLCLSEMIRIKTDRATQFQHIYAEGSRWIGGDAQQTLEMHADISYAKFNGSTWQRCRINTIANQIGSEWSLAVLDDVQMEDYTQAAFQARLQEEHNERIDCQAQVALLESRCNDLETLAIPEAMSRIGGLEDELTILRQNAERIERSLNHKLGQMSKQLLICRNLAQKNTAAISTVEEELRIFQEQQKKRDADQDTAIEEIKAAQDILRSLQQYCVAEVYTDEYRSKANNYIPLYIQSSHMPLQAQPELLTDQLYQALERRKYIFVSGGAGYGQTFGVTRFGEGINATYLIAHDWIFIPLDASRINNKDLNVVSALLETVFDKIQKPALMKYRCVIHISKLDSSGIPIDKWIKNAEAVNRLSEARIVFIFTARTRYMEKSRLILDKLVQEAPDDYLECEVQPLVDEQIQNFFQLFPKQNLADFCGAQSIIDITTLGRTPLMLHIMTGVLIDYAQSFSQTKRTMQRIDFYTASWRALHARVRYKLPEQYQDHANFMQEMYDLAKAMLKDRVDAIVYQIAQTNLAVKTPFQGLLETKMGALSPLSIVKKDDRYSISFSHPSLGYCLIAEILIENLFKPDFPNKETQQMWGHNYLSKIPEVLEFLVELLQKFPESIEHQPQRVNITRGSSFYAEDDDQEDNEADIGTPIIERSRQYIHKQLLLLARTTREGHPERDKNKKLASNALTVLCKWGRDLSKEDFSKLILHHMDATNGLLSYASFEDSDLTGALFRDAILFRTKFTNTILKQVRFLNANQFLETGEVSRAFAIYRSQTDAILAYTVAPNSISKKYQIAIVKIIEDEFELLRCWPAHDRDITAMDFIKYNETVRMASVGLGGTVRVWHLPPSLPPTEIAKLRGFQHIAPIHHLAWGADAVHLATGSQDGHVRIWDANHQRKVFKSEHIGGPIRALVWGKLNQMLVASTDNNELFICHNALTEVRRVEKLTIVHSKTIHRISSLTFSPDEKFLAIGTDYGGILICNLDTETKELNALHGHKSFVTSITWLDQLISSSHDQTIRIWPSKNYPGSVFQHDHPVGKVDVLSNRKIISGIDPNCSRFYFWNQSPSSTASANNRVSSLVSCMAANPRYPYVAAGDVHGMVMIYPFEDIVQPDFILPAPVLTHMRTTVQQLCWSKDGQYLASLGQDQSILIKNTQDPSHQKTIFIREEIDKCPMHIVWTTDTNGTQIFVIGYTDGTIEYYNEREDFRVGTIVSINPNVPIHWMAEKQTTPQLAVTIGQEIAVCTLFGAEATNSVVRHPHPEHLPKMIAWSEDGTLLASTDAQHMIRIWNTSGTTLTLRAQYLATKIKCLLWTEQWLLLGDSEKIIYWDMSTERGLQIPPKQMPVAARFLSTADGKIVLGHNAKISFFPKSDLALARLDSWQYKRLKGGFDATESDISGSKELSSSNRRYLRENGAQQAERSSRMNFYSSADSAFTREEIPILPGCFHHSEWIRFFSSVTEQAPQQPFSLSAQSLDSPVKPAGHAAGLGSFGLMRSSTSLNASSTSSGFQKIESEAGSDSSPRNYSPHTPTLGVRTDEDF